MASLSSPSQVRAFRTTLSKLHNVTPSVTLTASWQATTRRQFSASTMRPSKIGRMPLTIPPNVEVSIGAPVTTKTSTSYETVVKKTITVGGPLGTLQLEVPGFVQLQHDVENSSVSLSVDDSSVKQQKAMWGTSWSYLRNYINGVSEGHSAVLRLVGVGYRASIEKRGSKEEYPGQPFLCLKLGFTHPVEEGIPKGVTVTTPTTTRILLDGLDKEVIMSFAGKVRKWRPPEPYKGKGIFINDQTIKLKQKKIK